jgi:uncharacterized repeat protein (TIGR03803 family)
MLQAAGTKMTASLTTLVSFNGPNGARPLASLIMDANGNLFGTTASGGAANDGTVFEIVRTPTGYANSPLTLVSFHGADGNDPEGSLIVDANGDLFGTTRTGGQYNAGTVFEVVRTATGYDPVPITLVSFDGADGAHPLGDLFADADGNLLGTTYDGGTNSLGTVFEIARTASGYAATPTTLFSFNGIDGQNPHDSLIADVNGNLFGTTSAGGQHGHGTVFEIARTATGYAAAPTTLVNMSGHNADPAPDAAPQGSLIADANGNLFGTSNGANKPPYGEVFEIPRTATGYATATTGLASFFGFNGAFPDGSLVFDANGDLFGTTSSSGASGGGTIFELARDANGYATQPLTLFDLDGTTGDAPQGSLIIGPGGTLFGTTSQGGSGGSGTVFEITGVGPEQPPTISGTIPNQSMTDRQTIQPFATVTVSDPNGPYPSDYVRISLSNPANGTLSNLGNGTYDYSTGVYTYGTSSVADLNAAIERLVFTPRANQAATGRTATTTFTIDVNDASIPTHAIATTNVNTTSTSPTANNDAAALSAGQTTLMGNLLANDTDPTGDVITVTSAYDYWNGQQWQTTVPSSGSVSLQSTRGTFTISADGTYTFTANDTRPAQGHYAEDPLVYTISNAHGGTASAQLAVNLAGQARPDTETFNFNLVNANVTYGSDGEAYLTGPDGVTHNVTGVGHLIFNDGRIDEADGSPLVDDLYYDSQYHDVYAAGIDPDAHYAANGWHEGRNPDRYFNTNYYLSQNGDVAAAGINPLTHYDQYGWREGRNSSANFDTTDYELAYPDVAAAGDDPLAQYLSAGDLQNRLTFPVNAGLDGSVDGFDPNYYLTNNPDVAAAGVNPLQHYLQYGWHEGRNPSAYFNTNFYESQNPDVAAAGIDPLIHYDQFGWHEDRDPSAAFSTSGYLTSYADIAAANVNPLQHFLQYGMAEGRSPTG